MSSRDYRNEYYGQPGGYRPPEQAAASARSVFPGLIFGLLVLSIALLLNVTAASKGT